MDKEHRPNDAVPAELIGRADEWRALRDRCERARRGEGGTLWMVGEAGIGKTSHLRQLGVWGAEEGFRVLWGRHVGHRQAPPLHGLREALARLFLVKTDDGPDEISDRVGRHLDQNLPDLRRHRRALTRFLEPLTDVPPPEAAASDQAPHLYHLLGRLLIASARRQPLLLLLDDAHWADAITLDYLTYLAPLLTDQPILIVASMRPGESEHLEVIEALRVEPNAETLLIPRLDLDATSTLAMSMGGQADAAFCQKLYQLTEGVPLFVEQWMLDAARQAPHAAERILDQRPESISQTVSRRLLGLPPDVLALVQAAAVIGDRFSPELLQQMDGRPMERVLDHVGDLETRWHIFRSDSTEPNDYPLAFSHTLLRQVAYESLAQGRRQLLHAKAGAVLEEQLSRRPENVFDVSHHYAIARLHQKAADVLYQAGQRAQGLSALSEARTYYEQALAMDPAPERSAAIRDALGNVVFALGDRPRARELWSEALAGHSDAIARAVVCRKLGQSWIDSDYTRQWRYFRRGLEEVRDHPGSIVRAQLLAELSRVPDPEHGGTERDRRRIISQAAEALRILRRHPPYDVLAFLLIHLVTLVYIRLGDSRHANIARKARLFRRGVRIAEALDDWDLALEGRFKLAILWLSLDLARALDQCDEALELADDILPPDHRRIADMEQRMLKYALAYGDTARIDRYAARIGLPPGSPLPNLQGFQWQDHPEAAWEALVKSSDDVCRHSMISMYLVGHMTRLQRLADSQQWQSRWESTLAKLQQDYPDYFAHVPPVQWGLEPVGADAMSRATGQLRHAADLHWIDPIGNSDCIRLSEDSVEISPGPDIGLGVHRQAPCLVCTVRGDFTFEARIPPQHARRAGGLAVWDEDGHLVRFASGVDHMGQQSLAWHDGDQLRYACAGYLPGDEVVLRLTRTGRRYTAHVCDEEGVWHSCGRLSFGDDGPVEVGLFAEASYEFDVLQVFPICFDAVKLWVEAPSNVRQPVPTPSSPLYTLPKPPTPLFGMVGYHSTFTRFCEQLEKVASSSLPLLISGESGTGKELAARAIHLLSQHKDGPYIPLNVAALPGGMVESELFGHVRGAFTGATDSHAGLFAAANGGSIFLDELGELPMEMQARLLRVLDSGEIRPLGSTQVVHVDARMIAATNRDLGLEVTEGRFRQDLYFRFAEPLVVPPLRQRPDDIPFLVAHFLQLYGQGGQFTITRRAMSRLQDHSWPDNIRGLRQVIERAVLSADGYLIDDELVTLRSDPQAGPAATAAPSPRPVGRRPRPSYEELHRVAVECLGSVAAISRYYGASRPTVYRWIERVGIDLEKVRQGS